MSEIDYALGRTRGEYHRLIEQAELLRPMTERMLLAAGITTGMRVLDVGCAVGDVSFLVGEVVGERGSVVGVDIDRAAIELAEERRAAKRAANVEFSVGDAGSIGFQGQFDAVVGRFVLMFVDDPAAVVRRLAGTLRPGGVMAFQESIGDVRGFSPAKQPLLGSTMELFAEVFQRSGARLNIGLDLYAHMLEAGLEPTQTPIAEIGVRMGDDTSGPRRWALFARSMLPKIVEYGLATEADVNVETLEQRLRDEYLKARGLVPLTWLMVAQWARKPGPHGTLPRSQRAAGEVGVP